MINNSEIPYAMNAIVKAALSEGRVDNVISIVLEVSHE